MTRRSDFDRRQAVARLYDEACAAIDKERWQEAVEKLDRVRDNDLDFPGAEYRQRLAHKWHRIAKLHEMGQQHMHEARWHDALSCFRQIRRDVDEYKNVALLQRYCERQLIPPPPQDNRKPLLYTGAVFAAGVMVAVFGWQFTEALPPGTMAFIPNMPIEVKLPPFPNLLLAFATPSETPGGYTATPAVSQSDPTDDPSDATQPDATAVFAPAGPGSIFAPRPPARPRPTRTPTRVIFAAATSTRQPATGTPVFAPAAGTATPTIAGSAPTPLPTFTPGATATLAASIDPTPTPLPTSTQQSGVLNFTETPSPTPVDTATTAATIPTATTAATVPTATTAATVPAATTAATVPAATTAATVRAATTPAQPANTATATATLPPNTATATPTLPAATATNSATPLSPTPTDSATPLPPAPTVTRTPTPVPPTATHTSTPVPAPATLFITAREFNFSPGGGVVSSGARVRVNLSNQGTVAHDWVLKDGAGNTLARVNAAPGQLAQLDFVAPAPGVYNFVCDISDYAQQGMKGQLTVR